MSHPMKFNHILHVLLNKAGMVSFCVYIKICAQKTRSVQRDQQQRPVQNNSLESAAQKTAAVLCGFMNNSVEAKSCLTLDRRTSVNCSLGPFFQPPLTSCDIRTALENPCEARSADANTQWHHFALVFVSLTKGAQKIMSPS